MAEARAKKKNKPRKAALIGLMLIACVAIVFAARLGLGDVNYYQSKRLFLQLKPEPSDSHAQKLQAALAYIHQARAYDGDNSRYIELQASLLSIKANGASVAQRQALLLEAQGLYLRSLQLQPSWAYAWLGLFQNKVLLQEFDAAFNHAIERTLSLGGHEVLIQWQLLSLALQVFNELDNASKVLVRQSYEQALEGGAYIRQFIQLGEAQGLFVPACLKADLSQYAAAVQKRCEALLQRI